MVQLKCEWCGISFQREKRQKFCGTTCSATWRMSRPDYVERLKTPRRREASRQTMLRLHRNPEFMSNLRQYLLSDRNPFRDPLARQYFREKAKQSGFAMLNGGNGTGPTKPQFLLASLLGWPIEFVVPTEGLRRYPSHYKLDIANPERKIAIEVDGLSHLSKKVQARDLRKTRFLESRGWIVLRFRNKEVLKDLPVVISQIRKALPYSISKQGPPITSLTGSWCTTVIV